WKLRTGAPWRDLPERYGPWKTAHERLRLWTADGTWQKILDHVIVKDDSVGEVEWIISVDSSVVRAHQHAAGARKKGAADQGRAAGSGSRTSGWRVKGSDGPAAGGAPRSTWPSTAAACRYGSCSPRDRPGTTRNCSHSWTRSGSPGPAAAGPAPARSG